MTNKKTTKRALFMSLMAMLLCFTMLLGTTYAWFTDSVTSGNNIIKSGNLDIELEYWNGTEWKDVKDASDILTNTLWEPGVTEIAYLRVANAGSLALKYQLGINILNETEGKNKANETFKLSDYIMFGVVEGVNGQTNPYSKDNVGRDTAVAAVTGAKIISAGYTKESTMNANDELYLALVVYMPTDIGNVANHNGTDVPQIDLGINVLAAQLTAESDSFGNDYDAGAEYPTLVSNTTELSEAINNGKPVTLTNNVQFNEPIKKDAIIDLAGNTFEATGSYTLGNNADFTMSNGQYVTNGTYGHIDVRPDTAEGSVVTFENVDFTTTKKNPTYGPCTDRLNSVVEVTPATAGGHVVAVFRNCTFDNAKVLFEGMSGKTGTFEAIFDNCTFTALTSSSPIEVMNYMEGTITVKNCTFNLTCTSSSAAAICVTNNPSTTVTINAENNTINAVAATPYTYDAAAGETEVDNIKVLGTPNNIKFISCDNNTTVTETNTVKNGIAAN